MICHWLLALKVCFEAFTTFLDKGLLGSQYALGTVVVSAETGTQQTLVYDENGNLTSDGTRTLEWDEENRLIAVTINATGHRTEYVYDGLGRRVQIIEKDPDATQTLQTTSDKKYLWVGTTIAEERTGDDGGTVSKRFFSQGFVDSDGTILLYTRDHLGSIRELVDMQQNVRARYEYDPYGNVTKVSGDRDSVFLYTGHFWHPQSGLYLALYRAYDPVLGRWISRDPLNEYADINMYRYAYGSPLVFRDRDGRMPTIVVGAILGGVIGGGFNAFQQLSSGGPFDWGQFASATVGGAVAGAIAGTGVGLLGGIAAGSIGAATGQLTTDLMDNYMADMNGLLGNGGRTCKKSGKDMLRDASRASLWGAAGGAIAGTWGKALQGSSNPLNLT